MAVIKYSIPLELNTETEYGLVNIGNTYIYNGVLHPLHESNLVYFYPTPEYFVMDTIYDKFRTVDTNAVWGYPVSLKTISGNLIKYHNINKFSVSVYNYIRRIIILNINTDSGINNVLYIDPPYGYYDVRNDDEDGFLNAFICVDNCIDSIEVSPAGQIIHISSRPDNVIYAVYQLGQFAVVFSNMGIYYLSPLEDGFFEIIPVSYVSSFDVKSCMNTFAYNDVIWFLFNNELFMMEQKGGGINVMRIGGKNLISKIVDVNDTVYIFGMSNSCVINNLYKCKSILYSLDFGFSGICDVCYSGISNYKYYIRRHGFNEDNRTLICSIRNELNDSRLKRLKYVVINGTLPFGTTFAEVEYNINPNYIDKCRYMLNRSNIFYSNVIFTSLNIDIYTTDDSAMTKSVNGIDVYYEYVDNFITYRYEKPHRSYKSS